MLNCKINKYFIFVLVLVLVGIVLGVYCFFFHDQSISDNTSDWGSFGSYFGGTLSLVSIVLLYYTFKEQRRENHRNWFDAGLQRRIMALKDVCFKNKDYLQQLSGIIVDSCRHSPYDDECKMDDAKNEISNIYANCLVDSRYIPESLYFQFKDTMKYIIGDEDFDDPQKECYISETVYSLTEESIIIFLCVMCDLGEYETINDLKEYNAFQYVQTKNVGFNILIDRVFKEENYKNAIKDQKNKLIWSYLSNSKQDFKNQYLFFEDESIIHLYIDAQSRQEVKVEISPFAFSDNEKKRILSKCKEECDDETLTKISNLLSAKIHCSKIL